MQALSKKGVLFLTSGFHQHYVFQNIAHLIEEKQGNNSQKLLKIVLSDGEIYISGVFKIESQHDFDRCQRIREFDLLRVCASYEGGTRPIVISFLEIFSQGHMGIYGSPPISLKDYLESKLLRPCNGFNQSLNPLNFEDLPVQNNHQNRPDQQMNIGLRQSSFDNIDDLNNQILPVNCIQTSPNEKVQLSFQLSNDQSQYDLLNDIIEMEPKKRQQRVLDNQYLINNPQKRHKLNEQEHEQGEMLLRQSQLQQINNNQPQKLQTNQQKNIFKTQKTKQKHIQIIDLDCEQTQKQPLPFINNQSIRRQYRASDLKFIQQILQSDDDNNRETQKHNIISKQSQHENNSITVPRSQASVLNQPLTAFITPAKFPNGDKTLIDHEENHQQQMGSTIQRKKIRQQYNLLIENLYQSDQSFKIICRVNYIYQWRSKNGIPCIALELMDSKGDEIKGIVYMNHATKECKECGQMVEVGKVYCFQNGECKRDFLQKQALELVFNLRAKTSWCKEVPCGGRNKILPAPKIKISPVLQTKMLSISQLIDQVQAGKNNLTNIYGILQSFKMNQFERKGNNESYPIQGEGQKSDLDVELIELQNVGKERIVKKAYSKSINKDGPTNIYLNGFLVDPIERKKIAFACVLSKSVNGFQNLSAENFLLKNNIKKGSLAVLHNIRVQSTNNNTVHKLQKTKRTYMQIITDKSIKWEYHGTQFAAETLFINDFDHKSQLYPTLRQMLCFTLKQVESIMENPRVINYSRQPFCQRSIFDLNQLVQKSLNTEQSCFSEIKGVKIHSIEQKPSVDICFYCKKRAKVPQKNSKPNLQTIKHCQRCKMIVKTITMNIFNIIFADDTASLLVEVTKQDFLQTILGIKIKNYLSMQEYERKIHLEMIKYSEFALKLRSEKKIGCLIHKIHGVEKGEVRPRFQEIKTERKGQPKHYTRLQGSW